MYFTSNQYLIIDTFLFLCCRTLREYYVPTNMKDFICARRGGGGMMQCADLPLFIHNGRRCNETAAPWSNNTPTNESCVNWNQYYTDCKAGVKNPFQGAISFDNIGLAWVAIFQVGPFTPRPLA